MFAISFDGIGVTDVTYVDERRGCIPPATTNVAVAGTIVVMVVSGLDQAEQLLLGGELPCPHCEGVLRPFGHGRTRIVRGPRARPG